MATVTIQYWAAAREAAGVELESVEASTLAEALDVIVARRGDGSRLRAVLAASSFLVDGAAARAAGVRRAGRERHGDAMVEREDLDHVLALGRRALALDPLNLQKCVIH